MSRIQRAAAGLFEKSASVRVDGSCDAGGLLLIEFDSATLICRPLRSADLPWTLEKATFLAGPRIEIDENHPAKITLRARDSAAQVTISPRRLHESTTSGQTR